MLVDNVLASLLFLFNVSFYLLQLFLFNFIIMYKC